MQPAPCGADRCNAKCPSGRTRRCFPHFKVHEFLTLLPSSGWVDDGGRAMSLFTDHNAAVFIVIGGLCLYTISTYLFERE